MRGGSCQHTDWEYQRPAAPGIIAAGCFADGARGRPVLAEHRDRGLVVLIDDAAQHPSGPAEYTATLFPRLKSLRVETVAARMD